jgi:anaerobic selenocysteine-containing dehydrogenase
LPARERKWVTASGKANFITPERLTPTLPIVGDAADTLRLMTLRSNDQFNTTVYGYSDRFRGVNGTRHVVFLNKADVARAGLKDGDMVDLTTALDDGVTRRVSGFRVVEYNIPVGCCGAYFPETNPLIPMWHHDPKSKVPAYKAIPIRITAAAAD